MVVLPTGSGGFLNPQRIIGELGIFEEGIVVADFGCGHGYFSIPLARKVGPQGKIFALDVLPAALEAVHSRAKMEGISNIETKRCNLEKVGSSGLGDESCDIVLIANLLFQTEDDESVVKEAKRVLKKEGRIVFIDWKPEVPFGPQGKRNLDEEIKNLMQNGGFFFEREFPTDNYHYGMVFKK